MLSIDMDGVDLYMLQPALEATPRVLVVGYQDIIGPVRSLTVPPVKSGVRYIPSRGSGFAGASLTAFVRVLARWEYHFVGCEAAGVVGFFLRGDVIREAHRAGRGSVHVTTPEDSGCFDARDARGDGEAMARGSRRSVGARGRRVAEKARAGTAAEKTTTGSRTRTPGRGTVTTREDADTIYELRVEDVEGSRTPTRTVRRVTRPSRAPTPVHSAHHEQSFLLEFEPRPGGPSGGTDRRTRTPTPPADART